MKQGSVLSPTPCCNSWKLQGLDKLLIVINSFYTGSFTHADNIRTLATTIKALDTQVSLVKEFCAANFLCVNVLCLLLTTTEKELTWEVTLRWKVL